MTPSSFGSIIAFETPEGWPLAFHIENLELAKISNEVLVYMQKTQNFDPTLFLNDTEKQIHNELNNWSNSNNLALQKDPSINRKKVNTLLINNTQICNLKCIYCAAGGDGTYGDPIVKISVEKTLPQLKFFMDRLEKGDQFRINFAGGEPLLQPQIIAAICDFAYDLALKKGISLKIVVTTNGTCIDEFTLNVLKKVKAFVNISIDGPPKVNDRMRPQKNGESVTDLVIQGIKRLCDEKINLGGIGLTAVFDAVNTDVLETYEFFNKFSVDWFEFNFSHTEKSKEASENFASSFSQVFKRAWAIGGETELLKISSVNFLFKRLDERQQVQSFCGIRKNLLVIDARNQFYACPWEVGDKTKLFEHYPDLVEKTACQSCWARTLCAGGCEFIHKNSGGFDKNFCNRMKSLIQDTFIYYEIARRI